MLSAPRQTMLVLSCCGASQLQPPLPTALPLPSSPPSRRTCSSSGSATSNAFAAVLACSYPVPGATASASGVASAVVGDGSCAYLLIVVGVVLAALAGVLVARALRVPCRFGGGRLLAIARCRRLADALLCAPCECAAPPVDTPPQLPGQEEQLPNVRLAQQLRRGGVAMAFARHCCHADAIGSTPCECEASDEEALPRLLGTGELPDVRSTQQVGGGVSMASVREKVDGEWKMVGDVSGAPVGASQRTFKLVDDRGYPVEAIFQMRRLYCSGSEVCNPYASRSTPWEQPRSTRCPDADAWIREFEGKFNQVRRIVNRRAKRDENRAAAKEKQARHDSTRADKRIARREADPEAAKEKQARHDSTRAAKKAGCFLWNIRPRANEAERMPSINSRSQQLCQRREQDQTRADAARK